MLVTIYCGESWEAWSPKSIETGIGGSEEAVIYLSQALHKRGHTVTVYNKCGEDGGDYDGVTYKDYLDYDGEACDIFIGWRNINAWKQATNFKVGYHWLHDTAPEEQVIQALALGAHKIMVLSQYHRRLYASLKNHLFFVTQNGVNLPDFEQDVSRVPGKCVYTSSYDRGLKELLEMWPTIKLSVPHATLDIAYGFETWEKIMGQTEDGAKKFKMIKDEFEALFQQDGITHHGRVSHKEVAQLMLRADAWAYPTWWPEISCITAMKAQVGGAIPVVVPTAAVAETVQYGIKTDRGYFHDLQGNVIKPGEMEEQYSMSLISVLTTDEDKKLDLRAQMQEWARDMYSWDSVAKQWEHEFETTIKEVAK
jgi:glycosyltransferase involved in cell wall biosynthesis